MNSSPEQVLTKSQRKRRKRKAQQDNQKPSPSAPEDFEYQVKWFVDQLTLGLTRSGLTKGQIQASQDVIHKLTSDKITKISKRQLMHVTIPDYRNLIEQWYKSQPRD